MEDNQISLFLSYGHESKNKRIVQLLFDALSEEFKVWIDKRKIEEQDDWRREIVKGISETDLTVGLLSEYSTRERGVCLDELGISISIPGRKLITVLLESYEKISIPSTITRKQWLDLSAWKKYIDTDQWDEYFIPRIEILKESIKSKENLQFQGEISMLQKVLKPEAFNSKAALYLNSKISVTRPWLIEKVNQWTQSNNTGRFLLITGDAGTGKSHFSAMYQHYNPVCAAAAFFEHGKIQPDYVKDMLRYLIFTIATRYADYRYQLLNQLRLCGLIDENGSVMEGKCAEYFSSHTPESILDRFLCIPMVGGNNTYIAIVLDGLDEVTTGNQNPMLDFLCSDLFSKINSQFKFIITSRAEPYIISTIAKLRPFRIDLNNELSNSDIADYVHARLSKCANGEIIASQLQNTLTERCNQMFLYAELACDAIETGNVSLQSIFNMPPGIEGLFCHYFDRLFPNLTEYESVKDILRVICAFDTGNLSEAFLMKVTGIDEESLNRFYHSLRTFAQSRIINGETCIFLFHKSLYDWLTNRALSGKYFIDINTGRQMIANACRNIMSCANENTPYDFLKSTYYFLLEHGDQVHTTISEELLYALQLSTYNNSQMELYDTVSKKLARMTEITGNTRLYILSQISLLSWYYDVMLDEERALRLLDRLYKEYAQEIKGDPEIYTSAEINKIYVTNSIKKNYEEVWCWADALIEYIKELSINSFPTKGIKLGKAYYHRSMLEYRLKRYDDCIRTSNLAIETAEIAYEDPRKLKALIYIIQGSAYRKINDYDRSLNALHKSLEYRIALYGFYTLFTANSYHNLIDALYDQALFTGSVFSPLLFEYLENYRKIITAVVGEKNPRMLQYYFTLAKMADMHGETDKALMFARQGLSLPFKGSYYESQRRVLEEIVAKNREYTS